MKQATPLLFALMAAVAPAHALDDGPRIVEVVFPEDRMARAVELQHVSLPMRLELDVDARRQRFQAEIPESFGTAGLENPFDLVIDWPEPNEVVFLNISRISPGTLRIEVEPIGRPATYQPRDMDAIEAFGSDESSLLQKYFRARRFHRHWRHTVGNPDTQIALRAARAWHDASVDLVKRRPQVYRADPEVAEMIQDYRRRAANNATLARRMSKFFPEAFVSRSVAQVIAAPYKVVSDVPTLIAEGRYDEAREINEIALHALESSDAQTRSAVLSAQGLNVELLRNNAQYIENLQAASSGSD